MKRHCETSGDWEQERQKNQDVISVFRNKAVEVKQHTSTLLGVCGRVKLAGAPHHSLVLDNGLDIIPLIPVDTARNLVHWISIVGERVEINQLLVVRESLQIAKDNCPVNHENYIVKWEDVKKLSDSEEKCSYENKKEATNIPKTVEAEDVIGSQRTCHVVMHHVSTPFHVGESASSFCLVFISYRPTNGNQMETMLWLVLQREQVAWREFLVPNREYFLHFPQGMDKHFFDKSQKPLDRIMEKNIREIRVLFHHKIHFSKYSEWNGSIVPPGSKLYLTGNTTFSEYVLKFTSDLLWFRYWFSTSEADHSTAPLVTFYGKVTSVVYLEEQVFKSCYLCIHEKPKKPELNASKSPVSHVWMDPFKSGLKLEKNVLFELPNVTSAGDSRMKTGVPGELVQVIKLQDLMTGEERSVYTKHSYVSSCQQMARLTAGVTVCLSHLNRRRAASGKYYYITTMLTGCRVLDVTGDSNDEGWGLYGLCESRKDPQAKTWGVLEPFNVTKVAIRVKCNYCGALFLQGNCSNHCMGTRSYTVTAHAIAWINITHEDKSITMEKVVIKDGFVRKFLDIPENMWKMLEEAATEEEIIAFRDQALNELPDISPLKKYFQIYFSLKSREKCYISVKKMSSQVSDEEDIYYCINMEPISSQKLNTVAKLVMKAES